jgi:hypothetical protein
MTVFLDLEQGDGTAAEFPQDGYRAPFRSRNAQFVGVELGSRGCSPRGVNAKWN